MSKAGEDIRMPVTAARKRKQVPDGYLIIGI
jgi:hypothetical protein